MKILYQQNLIMTIICCEFHKIVSLYQVCVSVFPFLSYMSMLVPIVLVVGTKDCLRTMAMFTAVPSFM